MAITAVQHVRRMRGGAQSHLMRASDGHFYVIKFQNNPQHTRVLANELLASRLAEKIGLPVPVSEIVEVSPWIAENTPELSMEIGGSSIQCQPGLQFGSRYVVDPLEGQVFDYLPESILDRVRNLNEFAGMLAFDKWSGNANGRQAVFWKRGRERKYAATFIDQGYCFNAGEWTFPDSPLRGVYARNHVYAGIAGWQSFEPWLSAIESLDPRTLWACAEIIPPEWYSGAMEQMEKLVEQLIARRTLVRDLITAFRCSSREPFPNWKQGAALHG